MKITDEELAELERRCSFHSSGEAREICRLVARVRELMSARRETEAAIDGIRAQLANTREALGLISTVVPDFVMAPADMLDLARAVVDRVDFLEGQLADVGQERDDARALRVPPSLEELLQTQMDVAVLRTELAGLAKERDEARAQLAEVTKERDALRAELGERIRQETGYSAAEWSEYTAKVVKL